MYAIEIQDSVASLVLPELEVPLTESTIEGAKDVQTLDMNVYTSFIANKRLWSHRWAYMSKEDFEALKAFYDRQFTTFTYPKISIDELGVSEVVVRMTLSPRSIIDHCGTIEDVTVSFRETRQLGA